MSRIHSGVLLLSCLAVVVGGTPTLSQQREVFQAGDRVWVTVTGKDDAWQKGTVIEERLQLNSYLVKTDPYRGEVAQAYNVFNSCAETSRRVCAA